MLPFDGSYGSGHPGHRALPVTAFADVLLVRRVARMVSAVFSAERLVRADLLVPPDPLVPPDLASAPHVLAVHLDVPCERSASPKENRPRLRRVPCTVSKAATGLRLVVRITHEPGSRVRADALERRSDELLDIVVRAARPQLAKALVEALANRIIAQSVDVEPAVLEEDRSQPITLVAQDVEPHEETPIAPGL
jgi:hypothetical protein